jgi:hypothetical protein
MARAAISRIAALTFVLLLSACGAQVSTQSSAASASLPAATLIEPAANTDDSFTELAAGTYYVDDPFPVRLTFEVPDGLGAWAYTDEGTQLNLATESSGEVSFEIVDNVVADPCSEDPMDPPVGPSVDDLVTALTELEGFEASPVTDVSVGGAEGKQFTLTAPVGGPCHDMFTWRTTTRQNGVGPGEVADVRIVDVDGVRLLIGIASGPGMSDADEAMFQAIIDSVRFG